MRIRTLKSAMSTHPEAPPKISLGYLKVGAQQFDPADNWRATNQELEQVRAEWFHTI